MQENMLSKRGEGRMVVQIGEGEGCTGGDGNASQLLNNTRLLLPVHTVGAQCVRIGDGRSNGRQR